MQTKVVYLTRKDQIKYVSIFSLFRRLTPFNGKRRDRSIRRAASSKCSCFILPTGPGRKAIECSESFDSADPAREVRPRIWGSLPASASTEEPKMLNQNLIKKILREDSFTREEKARLREIFHFSAEAQPELVAVGDDITESKLMEILHFSPEVRAELRAILRGTKRRKQDDAGASTGNMASHDQ